MINKQNTKQTFTPAKGATHVVISDNIRKEAFTLVKGATHVVISDNIRKEAFTLMKGATHVVTSDNIRQEAFTLAEALITLGIIGVVAALTLPVLFVNHRKTVVETRLAKFYSTMNQAILQAEVDLGDKRDWPDIGKGYEEDEDGNPDKSKSIPLAWFNTYMRPYLNLLKVNISWTCPCLFP